MMQIVIDIPEKDYKNGTLIHYFGCYSTKLDEVIYNGTPLPKGHGRLIDEKDLSLMTVHLVDGVFVCDAPTIIEADKAESEGE